ncbi:MAG: oxidoreductase [Porticoccaceae bacterium]|nr:MAG: oxidoreductase [Porticoccaceae bacterium]
MVEALLGLTGKAALVAGGGTGIGRGCALLLARAGCRVAVVDRDGTLAEETAVRIRAAGGEATAIVADLRGAAAVEAAVAEATARLGPLAAVVNSVGGQAGHRAAPLAEVDETAYRDILALNLDAAFFLTQQAGRLLAAAGGGSLVHVVSVAGLRARPGAAVYGLAKAAVINLVIQAAAEFGPAGVRVNAVAPGMTRTERMAEALPEAAFAAAAAANPLGRVAEVDDVAGVVLFLASRLAAHVTGQVVAVDGGDSIQTARPAPLGGPQEQATPKRSQ